MPFEAITMAREAPAAEAAQAAQAAVTERIEVRVLLRMHLYDFRMEGNYA